MQDQVPVSSRHLAALMARALVLTLLVSCGGGGDDPAAPEARRAAASAEAASANAPRVQSLGLPPGTPIPPDAGQKGMFSPVYNWPLIAIHAALLPDGRVMTYGSKGDGTQTAYFMYDVWDSSQAPDAGHLTLPNTTATDLFCSSQVLVPLNGNRSQPQLVISNGDNWNGTFTENTPNNRSSIFDPTTNTLARGPDAILPRWYSTSTVLLNGEVYLQGGLGGLANPEIRGADGNYRLLNTDTSALYFYYPRNFVAPDGRIFGIDGLGQMYYIDPVSGALAMVGQIGDTAGPDASTAMFRPGRILQVGGSANRSVMIDINGTSPVMSGLAVMNYFRRMATATIMPDGQVLVTGGSKEWNELPGSLPAEMWNPQNNQWTVMAPLALARLYHSTALLLPDATVLVAGGGAYGPLSNLNAEVYYPPYLFTSNGQAAARPVITGTPDYLQVGKTIAIDVAPGSTISKVTLVKTGSVTHTFNMDQRFVELPFRAEGDRLYAQAPTHAADVPPGYYMVFVFDANGVPSKARILNLGVAADPNPNVTPVLASPGNQNSTNGTALDLALSASDPNGDTLTYSAAGLPPGLSISSSTGHITGTPTTNGSFDVVLSVTDGYNAANVPIVWQVSGSTPTNLDPLPPPTAEVVGDTLDVTAHATGYQIEYQWNFGDGTVTAWSSDGHASHVYNQPGVYSVNVTVRDGYGQQTSSGFMQTVQLPVTGPRPLSSSMLLTETPSGGGNSRLWVANPDNDTVSVFDVITRAKLAEVAVGASPRTLARAANGRIWVTNQRGASISVVDPGSLSVVATLMMPRASQPQGIVMSPAGTQAYVTLGATGQLLRLDTASFAQTGTLALGPQPGGLAMSSNGSRIYVSRFVTALLPGEATATVSPTPSTGGEVWVVDTASFTLQPTIVLQHSDKVDAENQGRGIPNYLGAPALSPDGSQAFVPSKQDNVKRGLQRDGLPLNFQNTVRAVSSRIVLSSGLEDLAGRIDHDNAGLASAALFDSSGVYLFVALETSREIAVLDAHNRSPLMRLQVGRTPQGLALSPDGLTLFAGNFMDRSISAFDLRPLLQQGVLSLPPLGTLNSVATEALAPNVLLGKQLFNDARDPRLARDSYMSCAVCHRDGSGDGRVWDMASSGEGLRNTIHLRGRAGMAQGLLHWSGNFDEVQDFEGQIRGLAGGTGLMSDAAFFAGTRNQPLGDPKAGQSADLDALAAFVSSMGTFDPSPARPANGSLSTAAVAGKSIFQAHNCGACHGGTAFTNSAMLGLQDIGTLKVTSGQRLGGPLLGIDVPTLRDVGFTAPYLHDGSATTLDAAVSAHGGVTMPGADLGNLVAYLREIGSEEATAPVGGAPGPGTGLTGQYFPNTTLSGAYAMQRNEVVDFDWAGGSPGGGLPADNFSVRWQGQLQAPTSGLYKLRTVSDDGVRVWVDGVLRIDHWNDHTAAIDTTLAVPLAAGQRAAIRVEYYERTGPAVMRLQWQPPGSPGFSAIPASQLLPALTTGSGLFGSYFNKKNLSGPVVLTRNEAIDFNWGTGSPGAGVKADAFSVRWTGSVEVPVSGNYFFQTQSDEGVRLTVNGKKLINNWTAHTSTTDTSKKIALVAGQRYAVTLEYFDNTGQAEMRLRWKPPGTSSYTPVPVERLYPN